MRAVVAATDFSRRGARAVARAALVAGQTGARLILTHVVDGETSDPVRTATEAAARLELEAIADGLTLEAEVAVVAGEVFECLPAEAEEAGAGLIVVGDHRRSIVRDAFCDTTVERLARVTQTPLLVARRDPEGPYAVAVAGVDEESTAIISGAAGQLAEVLPEAIMLVHAHEPPIVALMSYARVAPDEIEAARVEAAVRARRSIEDCWTASSPPVVVVIEGNPIAAIERTAAEANADLVVLATHRRSAVDRLYIGSVTSRFLRSGSTDLLIVPPSIAGT